MRFQGTVAIVTGAASGFGEAIARRFASEGASVVAADIDEPGGKQLVAAIEQSGGRALFVHTDVSRAADVKAMIDAAVAEHGGFDVLVNNAGFSHRMTPLWDLAEADYDRVFAVNTKSVFLGAKYAVPVLRERGGGVIVNIASIGAVAPRPGVTAYNATKGAVVTMTRGLAMEVAPFHIRVNAVNPVAAETRFVKGALGLDSFPEPIRQGLVEGIPLGRLAEPRDVAAAVLFLASDDAEFLTGVCLDVDGGLKHLLTTVQLHFDVHAGDGPFLLMVHGMLSSRAQWAPNLKALARVARPVTVELWGHGRSPAPAQAGPYHPDAYVAAFERLREQIGAERWGICGQSLGAALTLRYALDCPERVLAHVFTNSTSALADADWVSAIRAGGARQAEAIERASPGGLEKMPIHPVHARRLPPETHAALLADAKLLDPQGVARTIRYTVPESPVRERVKQNRVRTLLVCGERESRFAEHRSFAEQSMPDLEILGLDAGHAVNIEAAAGFDAAVTGFLSRPGA